MIVQFRKHNVIIIVLILHISFKQQEVAHKKTFLSLKTVAMNKHLWQFIYGRLTENVLTVIWFEEKYDFAPKINTLNSDFYLFIFF